MIELANLARGQTHQGYLTPALGHELEIPYIVLRGQQNGPSLLVTAGVHGAEYASIEAAYRVARTSPAELAGTVIILPIVNPLSFFARSIYTTPVDQKNLNRQFPGNPKGSFSERLADWLTNEFISQADAYLDLHGGDMIEALKPFSIFQKGHHSSQQLAEVFGIDLVVASESQSMTCSAGASLDVPSVLAEASGQGLWPEVEVSRLSLGVERVMRHLGMLAGDNEPLPTTLLQQLAWLSSDHSGLWYPMVTAGDEVQKGQPIGTIKSLLAEVLQEVHSPIDGVILFSVTSLAINSADPLFGIGA